MSSDPYNLSRFLEAQESMYDKALAELQAGKKQGHWMWYIFPQTAKEGMSSVSKRFAITGLDEAKAYLAHPILGVRLLECTSAVLLVDGVGADLFEMFGKLDAMKFASSMRLFAKADDEGMVFEAALTRYGLM